jgi:type IV secretory pathway ATPase VirB11/archaellum biosynthesis ATPase/intein/homing endonuclease
MSGRPFDEANPVLDSDLSLPYARARVAALQSPLSPLGYAFAFRRHRDQSWTLPLFIKSNMLTPMAAGLISFLVDGARTILIAGTRSAGKTSLLGAMMIEIARTNRILTVEDTLELPTAQLRGLNYDILTMKTRSVITGSEAEVPAEQAIRTALRLGDSALIIGEVRSSIPGWEEVLVVENGITKRIPIEELENKNIDKYKVPTLGSDLKVNLKPLADFVKHPKRDKLLEVTTKTGRHVVVTPDHSLFHATKDFKIAPIECKELKKGDSIVIPAHLPVGFNDINELNVIELLPEFRLENFESDTRRAIEKLGWKEATEIAKVTSGDIYNYFRTAPNQQINLPISSFRGLMQEAEIDFEPRVLKVTRGTGNPIPAIIPVNEDFCRFLGYYVSEGYYRLTKGEGGDVVLTNSDQNLLNDMIALSKKLFSIEPKMKKVYGAGESTQVRLGSTSLAALISKLNCGRLAAEKRAPPLIFGLSKPKIAAFLRGLYSGDGNFTSSESSGNCARYYSTSKKLVEDVAYLLLAFGIVGTIRCHKARNQNSNDVWLVEFKDRDMVETFFREIGFNREVPKMIIKGWKHTNANSVKFDKEGLKKHLLKYPRRFRHLFRFQKCSKRYLKQVVNDTECKVSTQLKAFANGEFFLDEVNEIRELNLENPVPVYDLSVEPSQNFIGGFGGILLHNTEARALYEAMRVGALAKVVAGTIHGASPYAVYDRVVNDLGVPKTSFKATDIIMVANVVTSPSGFERWRRLTQISEVRKLWTDDPLLEKGFADLMTYNAAKDIIETTGTLVEGESEVLKAIGGRVREWSGNWDAIWQNIELRAKIKQAIVEASDKAKIPNLLEASFNVASNDEFHRLCDIVAKEVGFTDPKRVFNEWQNWLKQRIRKMKGV